VRGFPKFAALLSPLDPVPPDHPQWWQCQTASPDKSDPLLIGVGPMATDKHGLRRFAGFRLGLHCGQTV
jgi:hypothetical protein